MLVPDLCMPITNMAMATLERCGGVMVVIQPREQVLTPEERIAGKHRYIRLTRRRQSHRYNLFAD